MDIRKAEQKDIKRIIELLVQINELHAKGRPDIFKMSVSKFSENELMEIIKDGNRVSLVAVDDNDYVVGYAICKYRIENGEGLLLPSKSLWLEDLCVDESIRGQGIGTVLFDAVEKIAKENDCDSITLNVWSFNEKAKDFYDMHGMKPQRTILEKII